MRRVGYLAHIFEQSVSKTLCFSVDPHNRPRARSDSPVLWLAATDRSRLKNQVKRSIAPLLVLQEAMHSPSFSGEAPCRTASSLTTTSSLSACSTASASVVFNRVRRSPSPVSTILSLPRNKFHR